MTRIGYFNGIKMNLPENTEIPLEINDQALEHLIEKGIIAARVNKNRILEKADRNRVLEMKAGTKKYTKKEIEEKNQNSQIKAKTNSAKTDMEIQFTDLYGDKTKHEQYVDAVTANQYLSDLMLRLNDQVAYNFIVNTLSNSEDVFDVTKILMLKALDEKHSEYNPVELAYAVAEAGDLKKIEHIIGLNYENKQPLIETVDDFMSNIVPDEDIVSSRIPKSDKKSIEHYLNTRRQDDKKVSRSDISKHNVPNFPPRNMIDGILPANPIELEKQLDGAGMHIEKGLKF